jgi:hypothetical protein
MITEIGIIAGEIWNLLDSRENVYLSQIIEEIKQPQELMLMSLGWLAREGHVLLSKDGDDYRVSLR